MRSPIQLACWCSVLYAGSVLPSAASPVSDREQIPNVHGVSLAGTPVDLPQALRGKTGVLVLGFSRQSRDAAKRWGKRLGADFGSSPDATYFELPMLAEVPGFLRGVVIRAMRKDISDAALPHFVPVTDYQDRWRSLAHVSDPDGVYVLVVDSGGRVRSRHTGDVTDSAYAAVRAEVNTLRAEQPKGAE